MAISMISDAAAPLLAKAAGAKDSSGGPSKLAKSLKKPTGAITVSVEYSAPSAPMDLANSVDFRTLSAELRRDKCVTILCDSSTERGMTDLKNFAVEQVGLLGICIATTHGWHGIIPTIPNSEPQNQHLLH